MGIMMIIKLTQEIQLAESIEKNWTWNNVLVQGMGENNSK